MEGLVIKLIMNSLYGRFGMKTYAQRTEVMNAYEKAIVETLHNVIRSVKLKKNLFLVTYHQTINKNAISFLKQKFNHDTKTLFFLEKHLTKCSIISERVISAPHVSAAVTSYGRILVNEFKFNKRIV